MEYRLMLLELNIDLLDDPRPFHRAARGSFSFQSRVHDSRFIFIELKSIFLNDLFE